MEKVFSILPNGNISVLGVHIGMSILEAERILRSYKARRINEPAPIIMVNGAWLGGYRLILCAGINDKSITDIFVRVDSGVHKKPSAMLIEEFEAFIFSSFEKMKNNKDVLLYRNTLLIINLNEKEELKYGFTVFISPRIKTGGKIDLSNTEITELYNGKSSPTPYRKITLELTDKSYKIAIVVFAVFALIIAYLFALNGRYEKWDEQLLLDKWTQEYWWNYEKPLFKHSLPDD
ncbi:MAG: hypothetical protein IJN98_00065 [Alistipes sp.]|nr:hypothetical protein [Alistipes sp.]